MGIPAFVGGLLGLGISALRKPKIPKINYQQDNFNKNISELPKMPDTPVSPDNINDKSPNILKAEEEERKRRAAQKQNSKTNFTSGLGMSNINTGRKTLLG